MMGGTTNPNLNWWNLPDFWLPSGWKKWQNEFSGPRLLWVCAMLLFCGNGYILIGGWRISFVATNSTLRFFPQIPVGGWFCWCLWLCLKFHRFSYPKWYQPYPFKNPRFRDPDPQLKWRGTWDPAIGLLDSRLGFHPQDMLGKLWDFFGGNLPYEYQFTECQKSLQFHPRWNIAHLIQGVYYII